MELLCIDCGLPRNLGKRRCDECHKKAKRVYAKKRHLKGIRTRYNHICECCKKKFITIRKTSRLCIDCHKKSRIKTNIVYIFTEKNKRLHRKIAEDILKRKLMTHEHVHHLDENTKNNEPSNLIITTRSIHGRIHRYLELQRGIFGNFSTSWYALIKDITLAWIDTQKVKCIKLWEISAP